MARDKGRERRDAAGVGPDPADARRRLVPIEDLKGYTLAAGEPDIRGWDVRTLGGRDLGEVEDLLVDPDRGEVVMLEVDMRGEAGNHHAEVAIRSVQLDRTIAACWWTVRDLVSQNDVRARDRVDPAERERLVDRPVDANRDMRFGAFDDARGENVIRREDGSEEVVVERRPVVEEVVVRRRVVDTKSDEPARKRSASGRGSGCEASNLVCFGSSGLHLRLNPPAHSVRAARAESWCSYFTAGSALPCRRAC